MKKRLSKFTLAASLAAALAFTFSSCSADGGDGSSSSAVGSSSSEGARVSFSSSVGGSWTIPFSAKYDDNFGVFALSGVATAAPAGNTVEYVTGTVNGIPIGFAGVTKSGAVATLTEACIGFPASLCTDKAGQEITANIEITVEFASGTPLIGTKSLTVACPKPPMIDIKTIEVGGNSDNLGSFVDLDSQKAYKSSEVDANAPKIDIVYGVGFGTKEDKIYSAMEFGLEDTSYSSLHNDYIIIPLEEALAAAGVGDAAALAAGASAVLTGSETSVSPSTVAPFLIAFVENMDAIFNMMVFSFDATEIGKTYAVITDENVCFVTVKSKNGTTDLVLAYLSFQN